MISIILLHELILSSLLSNYLLHSLLLIKLLCELLALTIVRLNVNDGKIFVAIFTLEHFKISKKLNRIIWIVLRLAYLTI